MAKEFQLKHQLHNTKLDNKTIDEYLKEFKEICNGVVAIHKPDDEDHKVINFTKVWG